ncbi:ABC transporter permease [Methanoregula sp.]|uniref:ABC transporter permease n=1 Tax=Methanoregula sp. TaxID=2052170 RepID=UPI003565D5F9
MASTLRVSAHLALRGLQRGNRFTTVLTVLIIALVFIMLCFQPSLNAGIISAVNNQIIDYSFGNIVVEPKEHQVYIDHAAGLKKKIDRIPGVVASTPEYKLGATYTFKDTQYSGPLYAIDPSDARPVLRTHTKMLSGEFLSDGDRGQIVLGAILAGNKDQKLDKVKALRGAQVGDTVDVAYSNGVVRSYRVKGIYATDSLSADMSAVITREEAESVTGLSDKASLILIRLSPSVDENAFKTTLMQYGVQEPVKTWSEEAGAFMTDTAKTFEALNAIMTIFYLLFASIVVFIVVYINTTNKRKQIAIMKAIGIKREIIINDYLIQVLVLCGIGIILGLMLFLLQTQAMTANPVRFPSMGVVTPVVSLSLITSGILDLLVVSFIAGYIPAWTTTREEILDGMRG